MNRSSEICLIVTSLVQLVFFVQATNFLKQKEVNLQMCSENNNITTAFGLCPPWAICIEKGCKFGRCIFSCKLRAAMLVLEISMHNFELEVCKRYNRSGTLCGDCLSNHWPLALSYKMDCVLCPSSKENWWKYVSMAFGPTTLLYLAITLFKLDMTSPYIYPFITYAQILSSPIHSIPS